jgi:hypothetical protein
VLFTPESLEPLIGSGNSNSAIIAAYLVLNPVMKPAPWRGLSEHNTRYLQLLSLWLVISLAAGFPSDFPSLVSRVAAPVVSFAAGMLLARPLLHWRYRSA